MNVVSVGSEQPAERGANIRIVIDDGKDEPDAVWHVRRLRQGELAYIHGVTSL